MIRAALLVSARAAVLALSLLAGVLAAAAAVTFVETSSGPSVTTLATHLGPVALAAALATTVGLEQAAGRWSGWAALGIDPRRLLAPLFLIALALGALQLRGATPVAPLPAPLDDAAWWDGAGWTAPPSAWTTPPHRLGLGELVGRMGKEPPRGARSGVDAAELLRRTALGGAWLLALIAALRPAAARREQPRLVVRAGRAATVVLAWQIAALFVAAAVAAP